MKKLISILFISVLLGSCQVNSYEKEAIKDVESSYKTKVIDSCQYIIYNIKGASKGYGYMAHKGNCKFCKERHLKEQNIKKQTDEKSSN